MSLVHPQRLPGSPSGLSNYFHDHFNTGVTQSGHKFDTTADQADWLVSADAGGSNPTVQDDTTDGRVVFNTDGDSGDVMNIQLNGESFRPQQGKRFVYFTRVQPGSANADIFIGIATSGTDLHASPVDDMIGFEVDGDGRIDVVTRKDGSETKTDSGKDIAATTDVELAFEVSGIDSTSTSVCKFYVDGEEVATHTTNIPQDESMSPAYAVESNGAEETMEIDEIFIDPDFE